MKSNYSRCGNLLTSSLTAYSHSCLHSGSWFLCCCCCGDGATIEAGSATAIVSVHISMGLETRVLLSSPSSSSIQTISQGWIKQMKPATFCKQIYIALAWDFHFRFASFIFTPLWLLIFRWLAKLSTRRQTWRSVRSRWAKWLMT